MMPRFGSTYTVIDQNQRSSGRVWRSSMRGCRVRPCVSGIRLRGQAHVDKERVRSEPLSRVGSRIGFWKLRIRGTHAYQKEPSRVPPRSSCIQRKEKDHGEADRDGRNRRYSTRVNPGDAAALREAERRFKELTGAGFIAAVRTSVGQSEFIRNFDPAAEECILPPA